MKKLIMLKHIYIAESFLKYGYSDYFSAGRHLPSKIRNDYIDELHLEYDVHSKKYLGDTDEIWNYFITKYPDKIERLHITSYDQLVYTALK